MITWLIVIIIAYFFFSLSYFGDKLILSGPPKPNSYTFFVAAISIFAVLFIPFIENFSFPTGETIIWIVLEAAIYILGLYVMFSALEKFDVSRVMTTIGATQPIFIFILTWIFWGAQPLNNESIVAFVLLVIGSSLISFEKKSNSNASYIKMTLLAALLFSLDYIFSKIVFLQYPNNFLQPFTWMRIFVFLFALLFLISKKNRKEIFQKQNINKKTGLTFLWTHSSGGIANVLQGFAISLAPLAFLPIVNSLRGIQYVFLFLLTLFFTVFFPKILKEKTSKEILIQKIISIIFIVIGLGILVAY